MNSFKIKIAQSNNSTNGVNTAHKILVITHLLALFSSVGSVEVASESRDEAIKNAVAEET